MIQWIHSEEGDSLYHTSREVQFLSEAMAALTSIHSDIPLDPIGSHGEAMGISRTQKVQTLGRPLLGEADRVLGSRARKTA